jgi:predicted Zn-dependent peptidase
LKHRLTETDLLEKYPLPGGLQLLHHPMPATNLFRAAVVLNVGTRDELPQQHGMAHFMEHMIFKGTRKRKAFHILNRIDAVGGELNAWTTKEQTVFYAIVATEHADRALELLADISFHSAFPAHEIEKEKQVVFEEIELYKENPEETILETFEELMYPNHPLGRTILGTRDSVQQYTHDNLRAFHSSHYRPGRLAVLTVGSLPGHKVERLCSRYFTDIPSAAPPMDQVQPTPAPRFNQVLELDHVQQAHVVLGSPAFARRDDRTLAFLVLNHYLGGNSMNNLLSLRIREKYGYAYNLYSFQNTYIDTGLWGVYFSCEPARVPRVQQLVERILLELCENPLSYSKLLQIKRQFTGSLLLSSESRFNYMLGHVMDELDYGNQVNLAEALAQIEALTTSDLQAVAQAVLQPDQLSSLTFLPKDNDA